MKKTKSMLTLIMAFLMVAGMVACGEEDENSSIVDNSDVISEIESKADTTTTTTEESIEPINSDVQSEWQQIEQTDYIFEIPIDLTKSSDSSAGELAFNILGNEIDKNIQLLVTSYTNEHSNDGIEYLLDDSTEWLNNSKLALLECYDKRTNFKWIDNENESIDPNIEAMVIENEEEVEINGRKFIKCSGYIDSVEREDYDEANPFKCMFVGYLTVYKSDSLEHFKEPDLCSFFTFMKEDIADIEYMDKVALHAAETLKFEDE